MQTRLMAAGTYASGWHRRFGLAPWLTGLGLTALLLAGCATRPAGTARATVQELNTPAEFNRVVRQSGLPAVVVFFMPGCPYCAMALNNQVPDWAETYAGRLNVVTVNMDVAEELKREHDVHTPPTYLLFKNGQLQQRIKGYRPAIFFNGSVKALMQS